LAPAWTTFCCTRGLKPEWSTPNAWFWGKKSPPTAGAIGDALFPGDFSPRGQKHARLVGSLAGRTPAGRAFAQFLLGPVFRLFLNVDFDQLASHLVTKCSGYGFQLWELGTSRETLGIEFPRKFPSDLAQSGVKFFTNFGGILAHVRNPLQIADEIDRQTQTSVGTVTSTPLAMQTMSCAHASNNHAPSIDFRR
jgi:hypothetical protein